MYWPCGRDEGIGKHWVRLPILLVKLEARSSAKCKTGILTTTQVPGVTNTFGSAGLVRRGKLESFTVKEANDLSVLRPER